MTHFSILSEVSETTWQVVGIADTLEEAETCLKAMQRVAGSALRIEAPKRTEEQLAVEEIADRLKRDILWSKLSDFAFENGMTKGSDEACEAIILVHAILEKFSARRG